MKIKIILSLLMCVSLSHWALSSKGMQQYEDIEISAVDERLRGTWTLETAELTAGGVTQKQTLETLFDDVNKLPRDLLTALYFFDNRVGVNSTETEFVSNVSLKGSFFTTNNELLTINLYGEEARVFTYVVENECLKIWYERSQVQFYLIYKLEIKNILD